MSRRANPHARLLLVEIGCALLWFHPAVWLLARGSRRGQELAADREGVDAGLRPSELGDLLMKQLRHARGRGAEAGGGREAGPALLDRRP